MTPREQFLASIRHLGYNGIVSYVQTLASAFCVEESRARSIFMTVGWEGTHEEFVGALQEYVDRKKKRS